MDRKTGYYTFLPFRCYKRLLSNWGVYFKSRNHVSGSTLVRSEYTYICYKVENIPGIKVYFQVRRGEIELILVVYFITTIFLGILICAPNLKKNKIQESNSHIYFSREVNPRSNF